MMKSINMDQVRELLLKLADLAEGTDAAQEARKMVDHIDNNYVVVYYP